MGQHVLLSMTADGTAVACHFSIQASLISVDSPVSLTYMSPIWMGLGPLQVRCYIGEVN